MPQKKERFYSYPFFEYLDAYELSELVYYDFLHRFHEIRGVGDEITFITYGFKGKENKKLKSLAPYASVVSSDGMLREVDRLLENLYVDRTLNVRKRIDYYCKKCNEYYHKSQTKVVEKKITENIIHVRIGKKLYFVAPVLSIQEPIGVSIKEGDTLLSVDMGDETWITPKNLKSVLLRDIEVPPKVIEEISAADLKSKRLKGFVLFTQYKTGFIVRGEPLEKKLRKGLQSYTTIYSKSKKVKSFVCPKCGKKLEKIETPFLVLESRGESFVISDFEGAYKLPILYCNHCGHLEFGKRPKSCPRCGDIMERKFFLKDSLIAVGPYIKEFHFPSTMFLHAKRYGYRESMARFFHVIGYNLFENTKLITVEPPESMDEEARCVVLTKKRGGVTQEARERIRKLQNSIENVVRYMEIYGSSDMEDEMDFWLAWKLEALKKEYLKLVEKHRYPLAFDKLFHFILFDLSRFYIPFKRKSPLYGEAVADVLRMLYPFLPEFSSSLMERLSVDSLLLQEREVEEVTGIDVLRDFLEKLKVFRSEHGIPFREPLKKVIFVTDYADDINALQHYIARRENILVFNAVQEWDEMEIEIEPNINEIGTMYRAWAPKIAFLLKRKNPREIMDAMEKGGLSMGIEGFVVTITPKMIKYIKKVPEGYERVESRYGDIYIYTSRDSATSRVRLVNEVIRRINLMRKDIEMEFDDLIDVSISGEREAMRMIRGYDDEIRDRCRARNVEFKYREYGYIVEWPIMGYNITIGINPLFKRWVIKAFTSIPGVDEDLANLLFHMGFGSIYELIQVSADDLAAMMDIPVEKAQEIRKYLYANAFKVKKEGDKKFCPFCGAEVEDDEFCPFCGAPLKGMGVEGAKGATEGNVFALLGSFDSLMASIPPDVMKERKLVITKEDPDEVKSRYKLDNVEFVWISYVPIGNSVKPKELGKVVSRIEEFLSSGGKVVITDSFDLFWVINGIQKLHSFMATLKSIVKKNDALLFFNVEELEGEELAEIMKYVDRQMK